jgi:hypothetical protein
MTVAELIEKLSQIENQDVFIMTPGYEGGYNDVDNINTLQVDIALNVNTEWYYGNHERIENIYQRDLKNYTIVKAIIL